MAKVCKVKEQDDGHGSARRSTVPENYFNPCETSTNGIAKVRYASRKSPLSLNPIACRVWMSLELE